ncbi:MAG: single-stranded DNA-binding protein [Bacteroidales bacterium]|nr:single-stranded DNA-binding protein [Bacteroidales bacterium]
MTTKSSNPNNFNLSGFVAVNATIRSFEKSSVARFPLSISRKEGEGDQAVRKSALINCECWDKNASSPRFDLLKKGTLVSISGYIRPDEFTDKEGKLQQRIVFVVTSVSVPAKAEKEMAA